MCVVTSKIDKGPSIDPWGTPFVERTNSTADEELMQDYFGRKQLLHHCGMYADVELSVIVARRRVLAYI